MVVGCEIFHYSWALLKIKMHINISQSCMQNLKIETWISFANKLESILVNFKTFKPIHTTFTSKVYFTIVLEVCASFGLISLRYNHLHLVLMPLIRLVIYASAIFWNLLKTCSNMHTDLFNQMVPLIFTLAHFTSSSTSCVAPLNLYQSQHVLMFYNFPRQHTRYWSLGWNSKSYELIPL
jgi:hypothetical protein